MNEFVFQSGGATPIAPGGGTGTAWDTPHVVREYVYGPDDVDEFILQSSGGTSGQPAADDAQYILHDANYNVVGIADEAGAIIEQYTYSPYGKTLVVERMGDNPYNRLGHQGLFFERFDADVYVGAPGGGGGSAAPADSITTSAIGLYYNRNRWYSHGCPSPFLPMGGLYEQTPVKRFGIDRGFFQASIRHRHILTRHTTFSS